MLIKRKKQVVVNRKCCDNSGLSRSGYKCKVGYQFTDTFKFATDAYRHVKTHIDLL